MPAKIELPKKKDDVTLVKVLDNALSQIEQVRNPHSVEWLVNHWFLKGARGFRRLNYLNGSIDGQIAFEDSRGKLRFKYEGALGMVQTKEGQLGNMDLGPSVTAKPFSLDAQRRAAAGKVFFDNVFPADKTNDPAKLAKQNILHYGIVGMMPEFDRWPDGSSTYSISIIPPWELGCMPVNVSSPSEASAIVRDRWVSLEWLKAQPEFKLPAKAKTHDLKPIDVIFGTTPNRVHGPISSPSAGVVTDTVNSVLNKGRGKSGTGRSTSPHVRLVEVWQKGLEAPSGYTLKRYIAKVGDVIIRDETFGDIKWAEANPDKPLPPPFPIGIANWFNVGFYGRPFVTPIVEVTNEVEEFLSSYFRNIASVNSMGALLVPAGMGLDHKRLKNQGDMKVITYSPNPLLPDAAPQAIQPVNSGSAPAQAAQLALQLANDMGGTGGLIAGNTGRLDSRNAIESTFNIQNIPLDAPARSLSEAFAQVYRAIMYEARVRFTEADRLELVSFDEAAAGLRIDKDGTVKLDSTGLPWPHQVNVNVKNASVEARTNAKQEALESLVAGIITPSQFWILNFKKELGYVPGVNEDIRGQVQTAQLNNLTLFSDGETPGEFIYSPQSDNPNILLQIVNEFMGQTFYKKSSVEVREAFESYKRILIESVGGEFPEQIPNAEDAAAQQEQLIARLQQQQAQQGQQGQ